MASVWPFKKKNAAPPAPVKSKEQLVVEYERKKDDSQEKKVVDRSHLEKKSFLEAMALLGGDD